MSSRREEERNEKIIRGLMKLPPNRRCINCNSLGPQYVCTNFWTFVCTTCSGIHREFTHRVKSVSMAKFTSQEVDSLQKGGNQRARELYLKAWDLQRQRLPDNSNVDKVREFIKNVYVNKMYAVDKSSDRPPRDPQGLRNYEDETRRASSYHSYSQSPPYDFQYEERRYGKHAPALTRRPGSDRGMYEGKLVGFSSPSRFSDHANDDMFANDGSNPRASDYSGSNGGDLFRSDTLTHSSQTDTDTVSPFRDSSRGISSEVSRNHTILHNSDASSRSDGGRILHPQRTASLGSFGSFDCNSMSFKSVNSLGLPEVSHDPEPSAKISQDNSTSFPSHVQTLASGNFGCLDLFAEPSAPQNVTSALPTGSNSQWQTSASGNFGGLDLFAEPFAPQTVASAPPTDSNPQLLQSSLTQSVDLFQQYPVSSVSTFAEQQWSQIPQPSSVDLFSLLPPQQLTESSNGMISDRIVPSNGGWATFDMAQNLAPLGMDKLATTAVPAYDQSTSGKFNPFSFDQSSSSSAGHEPAGLSHMTWQEGLQNAETTTKSTPFWNAFEDSAGQPPIPNVLKSNDEHFDVDKSLGFGAPEVLNNDGNLRALHESETPSTSLSSHFSVPLHDFSMVSGAGLHSVATDHKASNPFDLPYDPDMESGNTSQFWDMSSLQAALPSTQKPAPYIGDVNQSWFSQNSIPSYVPGALDHPTGSLGLIMGQTPSTHLSNIPAQAPVGGNPFA